MFIIKSRRKRPLQVGEPLRHESHKKPVTRRDFLAQGFLTGAATVVVPSLAALLSPLRARADLQGDIQALKAACGITAGNAKIPFICFDLAGGANIAGSNVLVGQAGGQMDFLSTQGYSKLGLPGDMLPSNPAFVNTEFGLAFHARSAFLEGMLATTTPETRANVNGCVIAARSENDTGNNPHNPMYGLTRAGVNGLGVKGELLTLIGSQNSESGGNSMAPAMMVDPAVRPTKIDRRSDVVGLVDTGALGTILGNSNDTIRVLESMVRISEAKKLRMSGLTKLPDRRTLSNAEGYEIRQKQRYIERQIRKWKRREAVALDEDARQAARRKVQAWQAEQRRHLAMAGREFKRDYARESITRAR